MSDRRKRVAEAIWCARHGQDTPSLMWDSDLYKRMADAALAVIDAEPTEVEIEAAELDFARDEVFEVVSRWRRTQVYKNQEKWKTAYDEYHAYVDQLAHRLIAARKDRT